MSISFADLGVPADLVSALKRVGITAPFEVQTATIPDALAGRDVLGRAPTGSGKTLAFGLPLIANLAKSKPRRPRALILSPTRELAEQIRRELEPLAQARGRSVLTIYGGVGFGAQTKGLRNGADLIVACPGRLIDLLDRGQLSLNEVDKVVVDEADRMADMGFLPAVRQLLDLTSTERQTVMFSATLDRDVQVLIDHYQKDPITHQIGDAEPDLSQVSHRFFATRSDQKLALAADLIEASGPTIVFCRTRHGVDRVARQLKAVGMKSGWIHGGRSQNQRDAALQAFVSAKVHVLVATDVAARGIHVDGVGAVIHFDPPADSKDYVHRSGRTARAGADGSVFSFINSDQAKGAKRMMRDVGLPAFEIEAVPTLTERAKVERTEPRSRRSGGQGRTRGEHGSQGKRSTKPKRPESKTGKSGRERGRQGDGEWPVSTSGSSPKGTKRGNQKRKTGRHQERSNGEGPAGRSDNTPSRARRRAGGPDRSEHRAGGPDRSEHRAGGPDRSEHSQQASRGEHSQRAKPDRSAKAEEGADKPRGTAASGMPKRLRMDGTAAPKRKKRQPIASKRSGKPRPKNKKLGRSSGKR